MPTYNNRDSGTGLNPFAGNGEYSGGTLLGGVAVNSRQGALARQLLNLTHQQMALTGTIKQVRQQLGIPAEEMTAPAPVSTEMPVLGNPLVGKDKEVIVGWFEELGLGSTQLKTLAKYVDVVLGNK